MKNKICFCLCIVQTVIIAVMLAVTVFGRDAVYEAEEIDLREYVNSFHEDNNFLPDAGYIPDAKTAGEVGSAIIDSMLGRSWFGATTVTYAWENRLWKVERNYFFVPGAFVVIEQDTGRIIKALKSKF